METSPISEIQAQLFLINRSDQLADQISSLQENLVGWEDTRGREIIFTTTVLGARGEHGQSKWLETHIIEGFSKTEVMTRELFKQKTLLGEIKWVRSAKKRAIPYKHLDPITLMQVLQIITSKL